MGKSKNSLKDKSLFLKEVRNRLKIINVKKGSKVSTKEIYNWFKGLCDGNWSKRLYPAGFMEISLDSEIAKVIPFPIQKLPIIIDDEDEDEIEGIIND